MDCGQELKTFMQLAVNGKKGLNEWLPNIEHKFNTVTRIFTLPHLTSYESIRRIQTPKCCFVFRSLFWCNYPWPWACNVNKTRQCVHEKANYDYLNSVSQLWSFEWSWLLHRQPVPVEPIAVSVTEDCACMSTSATSIPSHNHQKMESRVNTYRRSAISSSCYSICSVHSRLLVWKVHKSVRRWRCLTRRIDPQQYGLQASWKVHIPQPPDPCEWISNRKADHQTHKRFLRRSAGNRMAPRSSKHKREVYHLIACVWACARRDEWGTWQQGMMGGGVSSAPKPYFFWAFLLLQNLFSIIP